MNTFTLQLTQDEGQSIINLLDIATKAGGLGIAQQALPLALKIQAGSNNPDAEPVEDNTGIFTQDQAGDNVVDDAVPMTTLPMVRRARAAPAK